MLIYKRIDVVSRIDAEIIHKHSINLLNKINTIVHTFIIFYSVTSCCTSSLITEQSFYNDP